MKKTLHKAQTRGQADHGWLKSYHTFSFANYFDRNRMQFGALRVLNDDEVAPGMGFGEHPHDNMEIITIPLQGNLEHKDSMGNTSVISTGEVQVMSAGTGVRHSEFNASKTEWVKLLQIWIMTQTQNVTPRYDQKVFDFHHKPNQWHMVVAPLDSHPTSALGIHQQAYFSLADLTQGASLSYSIKRPGHGIYVFVIEGQIQTADETLGRRDGLGVTGVDNLEIHAQLPAFVLVMEVPL